jgi:WD40 repeat protein
MINKQKDNMFNPDINNNSISIYTDPCENTFELEETNIESKQNIFDKKLNYTKISNIFQTDFTTKKGNQYNSNLNKSIYEDCDEYLNELNIENNINIGNNVIQKGKSNSLTNKNEESNYSLNKKECYSYQLNKKEDSNYSLSQYSTRLNSIRKDKKNFSTTTLQLNTLLKINSILFNNINESEINLQFLKDKLRTIPIKVYKISNIKNRHLKNLFELQNFYIDDSPIRVIKISYDNKYLATGSKKGIIKIFEIINFEYSNFKSSYNQKEILSYLHFLNEKPKIILNEHTNDIIDLSFSPLNYSYLLSASIDNFVILWNINEKKIIKKYKHNDMVTSISFHPYDDNIFISGSLDHFIRIFYINDNSKMEYFNIGEKVTTVNFFPSGNLISIGTHNGKIIIYDLIPKISYNCSFTVRNKLGKNSSGKKVTNIEFVNRNSALITTCDSRIRYVNMPEGKLIYKYKGLINEKKMIRAFNDLNNDLIISGSENGYCYIWNRNNLEDKNKKNYHYEYFKPFSKDICECSIFVNENCMAGYLKKIFKLTTNIFVFSIIINATDKGRIQVLLNVDNCDKK